MPKGNSEHSILKIASNLAMASLVSGLVIAAVYYVTAPVAAQKAEQMKQKSMKALIAAADSFAELDGYEGVFAAQQDGRTIGYIVPSETKGYGGRIKMLVAVTADKKVIDFKILEHNETPGLGDNAQKPAFRRQFAGKGSESLVVTKDPADTENIQAMTGATISSRAVAQGVAQAVKTVAAITGGK